MAVSGSIPVPFSKRLTDVVFSSLGLLLFSPLILVCALWIKLSSPGPIFYIAPRAGRGGRTFGQLKLRTMRVGADRGGAFTAKDDPRVFPAGKWIRLFKLDELPQLWNVLRGEMSLVGPRPEDVHTVRECYSPEQMRVLEALPGLTGLPQVRFFPELSVIDPGGMDPQEHYRRHILPMRLEMDLEYIQRRSFWFDLRLIAQTVYLITVRSWFVLCRGPERRPAAFPTRAAEGLLQ